jgi:membrane associated rhomboid family serine protease
MSITLIIIIGTAILSFYAWQNTQLFNNWMFNPYKAYTRNQYYRFLSSGFVHTDGMHLLFNMITLYFFGSKLENYYESIFGTKGLIIFVITYLAGIVLSDLKTFIKHRNNPGYNSIGASGGVSSILFASILYDPTSSICLYFAICIPGFILGGLYLVYSYYQGRASAGRINHDAHLYGALFGIVFTIIVRPAVVVEFIQQIQQFRIF